VRLETIHRRIDKRTRHRRDHDACNQHAAQRRRGCICGLGAVELPGKRRCQQKRREQRQNFGGAPLGERHVQQSKQQHDAQRRQCDAAPQRKPDCKQQANLERSDAGEIRRPPFHDQRPRVGLAASAVFAIDRVIGAAGFLFGRDRSTPTHNSW
jgi:hypothetical protein